MSTVIRNTELVFTITLSAIGPATYSVFPVSPFAFPWLGFVAQNYSKFKFRKFHVTYVPAVGTTTAGNHAMAFGYDMADVYPLNTGGFGLNNNTSLNDQDRIVTFRPSALTAVWEEANLEFPVERFQENRFLDATDWNVLSTTVSSALQRNWGSDGYLATVTNGPLSTSLGKISVDYEIELINPIYYTLN